MSLPICACMYVCIPGGRGACRVGESRLTPFAHKFSLLEDPRSRCHLIHSRCRVLSSVGDLGTIRRRFTTSKTTATPVAAAHCASSPVCCCCCRGRIPPPPLVWPLSLIHPFPSVAQYFLHIPLWLRTLTPSRLPASAAATAIVIRQWQRQLQPKMEARRLALGAL